MNTNLSKELMTEAYRRMIRIRLFENEFIARPDRIGVGHSSVGMEASVVGRAWPCAMTTTWSGPTGLTGTR